MQIIPKANTWRKGLLLYRGLRYRKGFGVHSPFVFNLITKVIEEKCPYYSFYDIELIRKQLLFKEEIITYPDKRQQEKIKSRTIAQVVEREAIKPKHGALLFRLTNHFKSVNILQLGPAMGLSTLYLTSYANGLKCIALENIPAFASIAQWVFGKASHNTIDLRTGSYKELLPQALKDLDKLDFVFFNTLYEQQNNIWLFNECIKHIHNDTVFVFEGIKSSRKMRSFWNEICAHPEVTVTIDLYSLGIVIFNKKLHKRDYIVYF
ncbi:O-methyltransferase [Parabacteroides chinchillae]